MSTATDYIMRKLTKLLFVACHPGIYVQRFKSQRQFEEGVKDEIIKDLPLKDLLNIIKNDETADLWDQLAACIDLQYPINDKNKLKPYSPNEQEKELLCYCIKYAAYAYFMPVIGPPNAINITDNSLPFLGCRSERIAKPGYFIGVDDENKRIILCIRGTETIGDTLCDLDAKATRKSFGTKETGPFYYVHPGIFDAAKYLHEQVNVTAKIKAILRENEDYKIFVTGHSLGAGVCSLLGLLWKTQNCFNNEKFQCFSFASPLVIGKVGAKKSVRGDNMISVAVTSDIVTRVSVSGMNKMYQRVQCIKNTPNYQDICENIFRSKGSFNADGDNLNETELKLINELKQSIKIENSDLYPAGDVLWFVPECVVNKENETEKCYQLLNRIKFETSQISSFRVIQFLYDLVSDFYVIDNNEKLVKMTGAIPKDRAVFNQMVFNGFESFHAHFPGRYSNGFNINLVDILKMSKYYQKFENSKLRSNVNDQLINILVIFAVIIMCFVALVLRIGTECVRICSDFYDSCISNAKKFVNDYKFYADQKKKQ